MIQHSDQQWHSPIVESLLAQHVQISRHLYVFTRRIFFKKKNNNIQWQQQKNFNWKNSLAGIVGSTIPPLSVLVQGQKKYCHQFKRVTVLFHNEFMPK